MSNVLQLPVQETTVTANEVTVVKATGAASISLRGAERLIGVSNTAITQHFRGAELPRSKLAQELIAEGFEPAELREKGIPSSAFATIVNYYAMDSKHDFPKAKALSKQMSKAGAVTLLWHLAGYKPVMEPKPEPKAIPAQDQFERMSSMERLAQRANQVFKAIEPIKHVSNVVYQALLMETNQAVKESLGVEEKEDQFIADMVHIPEAYYPLHVLADRLDSLYWRLEKKGFLEAGYPTEKADQYTRLVNTGGVTRTGATIKRVYWSETILDVLKK